MFLSLVPQNLVVVPLLLQNHVVLFPISEPCGPLPFPSEPHGSLLFTPEPCGPLFTSEPRGLLFLWLLRLGLNPSAHLPLQPHFRLLLQSAAPASIPVFFQLFWAAIVSLGR